MGLLALIEMRAGRVADPEELSSRMRLQVLGVVPPCRRSGRRGASSPAAARSAPSASSPSSCRASTTSASPSAPARDPWGRDRHCVLITSACGSEGKTTLAAQLAERCVNAGLMTLLIDADLRNPTLSRMLDAPDRPGLINVLRGEVDARGGDDRRRRRRRVPLPARRHPAR